MFIEDLFRNDSIFYEYLIKLVLFAEFFDRKPSSINPKSNHSACQKLSNLWNHMNMIMSINMCWPYTNYFDKLNYLTLYLLLYQPLRQYKSLLANLSVKLWFSKKLLAFRKYSKLFIRYWVSLGQIEVQTNW